MAKEELAEAIDEDVSDDLTEVEQAEEDEPETEETNEQEEPELASDEEADDDGSILVTLGDEESEDEGSQPLREVRKKNRELTKRIRELEKLTTAQPEVPDVGPKPKLEDFEYDTEKFEGALAEWMARKSQADQQAEKQREAQQAAAQRAKQTADDLERKTTEYVNRAKDQGFRDFEEAQASFEDTLPEVVRSTIVDNAANPEIIVMALHQNPEIAEKFKSANNVRDAIKAAWELSKLEAKLKTAKPRTKPAPETTVKGGARAPKGPDRTLEKLEQEAERTGDRTKVLAYKRQLKKEK